MLNTLAFLDLNPIHIGVVLLLALLLFGPQKLPEVGKQIGNALRELKKAGSDMMNTFHTEPEQENRSYDYNYPTQDSQSVAYNNALSPPPDLTDYTVVGMPVQEKKADSDDPYYSDYKLAYSVKSESHASANGNQAGANGHGHAEDVVASDSSSTTAEAAESRKEG